MVESISWEEIYVIWRNQLWPNRSSDITPTSAMIYLGGYDLENLNYTPTFFGYKIDKTIVGVNSGHMCMNGLYRSRGLYVFENFRGRGIGKLLLKATISQAIKEHSKLCWSVPRNTSWTTYEGAGFKLSSSWFKTETHDSNAYCYINT